MKKEHIQTAKKIIKTLNLAGIKTNPKDFDFMYSHTPVGSLTLADDKLRKKIYLQENLQDSFSMYVHIPFCANKCTYCRFTADYNPKDEKINSYLDYLLNKELKLLSRTIDLKSRNLEAIYIGGGTPTFLSEKNLELLLSSIREKTNPNALIELEAHPNTLTDDKLKILKNYKISRLSIGVQSFNDELLKLAGRTSTADNSIYWIDKAMSNFDNVNIDLIFGLPGQKTSDIESDINIVSKLKTPSVTWYQIWSKSRETGKTLQYILNGNMTMDELDMMASKLMINESLNEIGYTNKYNDWYILSEKISPVYEKFRINAKNNIGIGLSSYLFVEPNIFENTSDWNEYFSLLDMEQFPIKYIRKMSQEELAVRRLGMKIKTGKYELEETLPLEYKSRLNYLSDKGILVKSNNTYLVSPELMEINKDYIARHLIGDAWKINKE